MLSAAFQDRYYRLLKAHVIDRPDRQHLEEANELGRELMLMDVAPEKVAELHETGLERLAAEFPDATLREIAARISAVLKEILACYRLNLYSTVEVLKRSQDGVARTKRRLRKTAAELKKVQGQLIEQEALRTVGQLAGGVAHDLRNSLSPILGYAELLFLDPDLSPKVRDWVSWIYTAAQDVAASLDRLQLIGWPGPPAGRSELENLRELLLQIPELTRPKWQNEAKQTGREISIELELEDVSPVWAVAAQLRQALMSLVFNAVDAMPAGGRITLRLREAGEGALVEVADTGIGMSDEQRRRCFEPFYRSKAHGTGLGLSVCREIVQRHGGRIEVETAPGQGSTFRIFLPSANHPHTAEYDLEDSDNELPPRRILYIEEDVRLRIVVKSLLDQLGQQVDLADDGDKGLAMLAHGDYDVVLTEVGMAGMDGRTVVHSVKETRPEMPVVLFTGWPETMVMEGMDAQEKPAGFIQKPPTLAKLRKAIEQATSPRC